MTRPYILALIALAAALAAVLPFDHDIALWASTLPEVLHHIARVMAVSGKGHWYLGGSAIVAFVLFVLSRRDPAYRLRYMRAVFVFIAVAGAGLVNDVWKPVFGRPRPYEWLQHPDAVNHSFAPMEARFSSFPSGHTNSAVAFALAMGVVYPRTRLPLLVWAVAMGISRVVVNDHYPSDVLGGAFIAVLTTGWLIGQARNRGLIRPLRAAGQDPV